MLLYNRIPKKLFSKWAIELCAMFPTDLPQLYYFESSMDERGKPVSAGGILYNTWCNTRKELRKIGLLVSPSSSRSNHQPGNKHMLFGIILILIY